MKFRSNKYLTFLFTLLLSSSISCGVSSITNQKSDAPAEAVGSSQIAENLPLSDSQLPNPTAEGALVASDLASVTRQAIGSLDLQSRLIELYDLVNPSVVQILVYTSKSDPTPLGSGSGFVYDLLGRIVTNNHVVADGLVFEVVFSDGSRSYADIVGRDVDSDLAVIEAEQLPDDALPIELGNSDQLLPGQLVIAIGNPFGEQGSM